MKKEKCCRTCRHWTDENVNNHQPNHTTSAERKWCAVQAHVKTFDGKTVQIALSRAETCCISQWREKTNQLELFP